MTTSEVTSRLLAARRLIAGVFEGEVEPAVAFEGIDGLLAEILEELVVQ